jgi:hypothetical protein
VLNVRLPVLAHLVFTLRLGGFVCAYVPFETAWCLLTRPTSEGELDALHDLVDRAVKESANERAAEKVYDFLLFGREVYLIARGRPRGAGSAQPSFGQASWQRMTFRVSRISSIARMIAVA